MNALDKIAKLARQNPNPQTFVITAAELKAAGDISVIEFLRYAGLPAGTRIIVKAEKPK